MRLEFSANLQTHTALWPLVAVRIFIGNCVFSDVDYADEEHWRLYKTKILLYFQTRNHHISFQCPIFSQHLRGGACRRHSSVLLIRCRLQVPRKINSFIITVFVHSCSLLPFFFYNSYNNQNHWTDDGGESARSSCAKWHHRPGASANQELFARQVTVFRTRTFVPFVMDCKFKGGPVKKKHSAHLT